MAGIKLRDMKRAMMTVGSNTHASCMPNRAPRAVTLKIPYFIKRVHAGNFPYNVRWFVRAPAISSVEPSGQIYPQKNLPKTVVSTSNSIENCTPGRIIRSLTDVNIMINGSIIKNVSVGKMPERGYVVDHNI